MRYADAVGQGSYCENHIQKSGKKVKGLIEAIFKNENYREFILSNI